MLAEFFDESFNQAPARLGRLISERKPDAYPIPSYRAPRRLSHMDVKEEAQHPGANFDTDRYSIELPPSWLPTALAYSGMFGQCGSG